MEEASERKRKPLVRASSEETSGDPSHSPSPGDTLPWNLPKHHRIKRSKSASGDVLDPAERAVIRIAGMMFPHRKGECNRLFGIILSKLLSKMCMKLECYSFLTYAFWGCSAVINMILVCTTCSCNNTFLYSWLRGCLAAHETSSLIHIFSTPSVISQASEGGNETSWRLHPITCEYLRFTLQLLSPHTFTHLMMNINKFYLLFLLGSEQIWCHSFSQWMTNPV